MVKVRYPKFNYLGIISIVENKSKNPSLLSGFRIDKVLLTSSDLMLIDKGISAIPSKVRYSVFKRCLKMGEGEL